MTVFVCECSHTDADHPEPTSYGGLASNGPVYPCNKCGCEDMRIVRTIKDAD